MNDLINKLLKYKSDNDFEEAEKLAFANFLKKNDDAYYRTNSIAHITASSWIVNQDFSKVLMCYHKTVSARTGLFLKYAFAYTPSASF